LIRGLYGKPFLDLRAALERAAVDMGELDVIHDEVCLALANIPTTFTGGSHRSMGIMPGEREKEALMDYGEVIRAMTESQFATLVQLGGDAYAGIRDKSQVQRQGSFGEEREWPLNKRQMLWLRTRFGVYFPWKVFVELMASRTWDEKSTADGKAFSKIALHYFPRTVAWIRTLPFVHVGRVILLGLEAHDYGTVHRDGMKPTDLAQFISVVPGRALGNRKTLFLYDEATGAEHDVDCDAYWFNDGDYHGVRAASCFRYSIRIDGMLKPEFCAMLAP
jgi:hypothetical protein